VSSIDSKSNGAGARGARTQPVIAPAIQKHYPDLNDAQKQIVGHIDGPLLVIAGPGSGKTYSIVLRALNLLLLGKAQPKQLILCAFTEKAAFEMRDRLAAAARLTGWTGDLSELTISTIHSLCNRVLTPPAIPPTAR
jgi:DNA helicase II / ATP-dependent DNA helicase PcrA